MFNITIFNGIEIMRFLQIKGKCIQINIFNKTDQAFYYFFKKILYQIFWRFDGSENFFIKTKLLIKCKRQKIKKNSLTILEKIILQITLFFYKNQLILFEAGCSEFFFIFEAEMFLICSYFPRLNLAMPQRRMSD